MSLLGRCLGSLTSMGTRRSYALHDLDLKLDPFLNMDGGFFIEAGANNGRRFSNTLYFEKYRGWTGMLIEPIPELAKQCRKNRRRCLVENCALVSFDYEDQLIEMTYCDLMSLVNGAMHSAEEESNHIKNGCEMQNIEGYVISVPARTLTSLLELHGISKVDLLSLDVEGYELNALQGIDFQRYRPEFMLIEARYRNDIDSFLSPLYEPIAELSHHDVLYRRAR